MDEPKTLYVLIAPEGELSGNGQLRETVSERRNRKGDDVPFWYIPPPLVQQLGLGSSCYEAVAAEDLTAVNWLQLRFGGEVFTKELDVSLLRKEAMNLPPEPVKKDISL